MKPNYKNSALSKSEVGKLFLARLEEEMKEENADEMDERQTEADGDGCQALRGALVGRS